MDSQLQRLFYSQVMPQLPKKWVSHALGRMAHWQWPEPLHQRMIQKFVEHYQIDVNEAEKPLNEYKSLGDFFSRALRKGARPIESDLVCPCDGRLIRSGLIHEGLLIQAKGKSYSLADFVPENPWAGDFQGGSFFTFYLAPHNYHRVHMPMSGSIHWTSVVPGELWPVNSWSVRNIDQLYVSNERLIAGIECERGKAMMAMVGATNVGSISVSFDPNIKTNQKRKKEMVLRRYDQGRSLEVGEEFGTFHLGSTVVLILDSKWGLGHLPNRDILMGQSLVPSKNP